MSECTSKQEITTKQTLIHITAVIIGILLASLIEKQGYPWIGWGIGGLIISLGTMFAYVPSEKRWTLKNLSITILTIIVCSVVYNWVRVLEM